MVDPVELPDAIRHATLFPQSDLSDFPPGHPTRRIQVEGVFVTLPVVLPIGLVFPERVEESRIEQLVDAVRRALRTEEREQATAKTRMTAARVIRHTALIMRPQRDRTLFALI